MATSPANRVPAIDRSRSGILQAVTAALVARPDASLAEIAQAVGIGRTTLHRMFPTREDVLTAAAEDAIAHLAAAYVECGIPDAFTDTTSVPASWNSFHSLIATLIPMGPRLQLLLTLHSAGDATSADYTELDAVMLRALERGRRLGALSSRGSASWAMEALYALIYVAWEQVDEGSLAMRDGADLVLETWRSGVDGVGGAA